MPSIEQEMSRTLDDIKVMYEGMKKDGDEVRAQVEKHGVASADLIARVDVINDAITILQEKYNEQEKLRQRPTFHGPTDVGNLPADEILHRSAFDKYVRQGLDAQFTDDERRVLTDFKKRALSSASDSAGGFLVPISFESEVIMAAFDEAEIRPLCQVGTTGRDKVRLPSLQQPTVAWGTVGLATSDQTLEAGGEEIAIWDLKALVRIHNNTLDDAEADIWSELTQAFSMAVAEAEDDAFATGAGNDSPQGLLGRQDILDRYVFSGVAAALSDASNNGIDPIIDALHKLKKTYRRNATFAMNSTIEGVVRKFKDANDQYYWEPASAVGNPSTLMGRPIVNPEALPNEAANAHPIVVGDFRKGFKIRDRMGMSVTRLVEKYSDTDETGFQIKRRTGGKPVIAEAFVPIKCATS